MTVERVVLVAVPTDHEVAALVRDLASARVRSEKADAGDRGDVIRFERLATQVERVAIDRATTVHPVDVDPADHPHLSLAGPDAASWSTDVPAPVRALAAAIVESGECPVLLVDPFAEGATPTPAAAEAVAPPAVRWDSGGQAGRKAVEARFRAQVDEALAAGASDTRPFSPSGVSNQVLTEVLRDRVMKASGSPPRPVPVEYRDGSRAAHDFTLRALPLVGEMPADSDATLRFALLSIRHTEMDPVVDGAWLRNAEVSRVRQHALTDDLVYATTRDQLDELTADERTVRLWLYQTGLEPAIVGFYKALVDHLVARPGSAAVQPMYYASGRPSLTPTRDRRGGRPARSTADVSPTHAPFREGTPWAM